MIEIIQIINEELQALYNPGPYSKMSLQYTLNTIERLYNNNLGKF